MRARLPGALPAALAGLVLALSQWPAGAAALAAGGLPGSHWRAAGPVEPAGYRAYRDEDPDEDGEPYYAPPPPRYAPLPAPPPVAPLPPPAAIYRQPGPPAAYYGPPAAEWLPPPRPSSCGVFRYWNGERCADARYDPPYIGPRW